MRPLALALIALPWLVSVAPATGDDAERTVIRHIGAMLAGGAAPGGIAVAVRFGGRTLFFEFGHADRERRRPITPDTLFNLGSVGKVFDTALLADASRRGELSVDDPVVRHLPELSAGGDIRRVTLGQLTTYTSGLVLPQDHPPWPDDSYTKPEFITTLVRWRADAEHQPGRQLIYSHAGYELLHLALERGFAVPYAELMRARVLAPLAMTSTTLPEPATDPGANPRGRLPPSSVARAVQGFSADGETVGLPGDLQGYYHWLGAGQMYSSARDLARFVSAGLGELHDQADLHAAIRVAQRGIFPLGGGEAQAMAWVVHDGEPSIVDKFGGLYNASAYIGMVPKSRLGVVILTNRGSQDAGTVGRAILRDLARP